MSGALVGAVRRMLSGSGMRTALVWTVRLSSLAGWVSTLVACWWLLGATAMARPWVQPFVWGAVATGCAVLRVVALWLLREVPDGEFADEFWVKLRTFLLWLLVAFSSGALFVALLTSSDSGDKLDSLRDAGAEVSTATVVERQSVREELSDGAVKGYVSRLVVAVPGGVERLTVRGAYTEDKPREGTEVEVLWARSDPGLGGYANESKDLTALAESRWQAFQDDELGDASLVAFIVIVGFGSLMAPLFAVLCDADELQRRAWSPGTQTVRAVLTVAVFWGWSPFMLGHQPSLAHALCAAGGFVLILVVYLFSSAASID